LSADAYGSEEARQIMKAFVFELPAFGKWARPLPPSPSRGRRLIGSLRSIVTWRAAFGFSR